MADTIKIDISSNEWTDVTNGVKTGVFTNNSYHSIRYRESLLQPSIDDTFGHVLNPQENRSFDLENNSKIWALGFHDDAAIALTKNHAGGILTNAKIEFKNGPNIDVSGRLRVSEPFGVIENKNITGRNRNQWNEIISGVILTYDTLVGGPFTAGEEIRGTGDLLPIGIINSDNGSNTMSLDVEHHDFTVGMTVTGQDSGATASLLTTNSGSDIQHNYDHGAVDLKVGTGAGDFAFRQTYRSAAYIPFKSNYPTLTFKMAPQKTNVIQRAGAFNDLDGLFIEVTDSDIAFVVRSSTSGTAFDTRITQNDWNIDRLDGGASGGPNPSGIIIDMSKVQLFACPFLWQGVGPIYFGFHINDEIKYCHVVRTSNVADVAWARNPSLPIRYEIRNTGITSSPTTMEEICGVISSEGGFTLPGFEFTSNAGITKRSVDNTDFHPIFAIRLKKEFPAGKRNARSAKFIEAFAHVSTNDALILVRHLHSPIDIVATWSDVGGDSAVEFSTDITAATGRPFHTINGEYIPTSQGNKPAADSISSQFINLHSFLNQNYNSDNSEIFVIYGRSITGTSNILSGITHIEFD